MRLLALTGISVAVLAAFSILVKITPKPQMPVAEPASMIGGDVVLETETLAWGLTRNELRTILDERGYSKRRQAAATLGFRNEDHIFSLAYKVTNKSNEVLVVFHDEAIGLGSLPIVTGDEKNQVQLALTTHLDPHADFVGQPHIGGELLPPGETYEATLSIPYPLEDHWKNRTDYQPETIRFCVGLTNDTQGATAKSLGGTGTGLYWPMGKPSPIEACTDVKR